MDATNTAAPSAHVLAHLALQAEEAANYLRDSLRDERHSWEREQTIGDVRSLEKLSDLIGDAIKGRRSIDDAFQYADSYCRGSELSKDDIDRLEDLAVEEEVALEGEPTCWYCDREVFATVEGKECCEQCAEGLERGIANQRREQAREDAIDAAYDRSREVSL